MIDRFRRWLRNEIREALSAEPIQFADPLSVAAAHRADLDRQLRDAANVVGANVIVGAGVVMWGGKGAGAVGIELHDRVRIYDSCRLVVDRLSATSGIVLEADVAINFACYIDGSGGVRIGARTILAPNVVIVSSRHRIETTDRVQGSGKTFGRVDIGRDVWIGANAVVLAGVTIGDGAVVGAGAIVNRNVAPDVVVAGNPATAIRTREMAPPLGQS